MECHRTGLYALGITFSALRLKKSHKLITGNREYATNAFIELKILNFTSLTPIPHLNIHCNRPRNKKL